MAFRKTLWEDDWTESMASFEPLKQHDGDVYYDSWTNRFVQLRKRNTDSLVFGEPCEYYEDAKTHIFMQTLSVDYLEHLVKIENIDKFDKVEYDGIGWVIKGVFED